jgi:phosphorylcholine metabolism protein LicD
MKNKVRIRNDQEMHLREKELFELVKILDQNKINFFLWGGALLGIKRDGKLLEWDWDIEIGLFEKDLKKNWIKILQILNQNNFNIYYKDYFQLKISFTKYSHQETSSLSLIGWRFDFLTNNYIRKRLSVPKFFFDNMQKISFKDYLFNCPNPVEEFLEFFYGNWKKQIITSKKDEYLSEKNYKKNNWKLYVYKDKIFSMFLKS